jgi:thiol-disulfide isomerase/thioredoxin
MASMQERWRGCICYCFFVLLSSLPLLSAEGPTVPRFKWGQSKEQIFLTIMVRDLDEKSVSVTLTSVSELSFRGKNTAGEEFALDLEFREDVTESLKWEISARSDKWGTAIFCVLSKANKHRWDVLVTEPKKYKNLIDKDWTREDAKLEPEEEIPYVDDNAPYLIPLTKKNLQKTIAKYATVLVNVRYPWCTQCKNQDEAFAAAAKVWRGKGRKDVRYKSVGFAVLDAREERQLARTLEAKCDHTCTYKAYTGPDEDPVPVKSQWNEISLSKEIHKFLDPAVQVMKDAGEVEAYKKKNTTCMGKFASDTSPEYRLFKKIAGLMRGDLVFAAVFGESAPVEIWPQNQNFSFKYDGSWSDNGTEFHDWLKPRSVPLLQEYDWQLREMYEKLNLPLAKIWIDDKDANPSLDKVVRFAVRRVAKKFIGKIAFVEVKKTTYSYELRDFGLTQPEMYPAFGIASNSSYNSEKYGFEITSDIAESAQAFWKDADIAVEKVTEFCEKVLAGSVEVAHESGRLQTNWTKGQARRLVWKNWKEIMNPEKPILMEMFGKYRQDNDHKLHQTEVLADVLDQADDSFTVASYDTSENYLPGYTPGNFKRQKYASETEWFWVPAKPAGEARPAITKLMKPKKDAPVKNVVDFALKQSGGSSKVEDLMGLYNEKIAPYLATTTTMMPPITMDPENDPVIPMRPAHQMEKPPEEEDEDIAEINKLEL